MYCKQPRILYNCGETGGKMKITSSPQGFVCYKCRTRNLLTVCAPAIHGIRVCTLTRIPQIIRTSPIVKPSSGSVANL